MAEITEAKIRQAIWMLKAKKTKKAVCEHLGIAYNTKRLEQIINDFHDKLNREAELKKKARNKIFTPTEKQGIADAYLAGETQSALAKQFYISCYFVFFEKFFFGISQNPKVYIFHTNLQADNYLN